MKRKTENTLNPSFPIATNSHTTESSTSTQNPNSPRALETTFIILENTHNTHLINRTLHSITSAQSPISSNCLAVNSPFEHPDTIHFITKFLTHDDILNFLLINKAARFVLNKFDRLQVVLTPYFLLLAFKDNEKLQLSQKNSLPIKIRVTHSKDNQNLINFISTPHENQQILNKIEALELGKINKDNKTKIQELLNLLAQKIDQLPNLISLSCGDISDSCEEEDYDNPTLKIPDALHKLTSFSSGDIIGHVIIDLSQNLTSFMCENILGQIWKESDGPWTRTRHPSVLTLGPEECRSLSALSIGNIGKDATFHLPLRLNNLTSISCKNIDTYETFLSHEPLNLKTLSLGIIGRYAEFDISNFSLSSLTSLSVEALYEGSNFILPQELLCLETLSFGSIYQYTTLDLSNYSLPSLITLSCETICSDTTLILPQDLTSLTTLTINKIENNVYLQLPESLHPTATFKIIEIGDNAKIKLPKGFHDKSILEKIGKNVSPISH